MNTSENLYGYPLLEKIHETRGSVFYKTVLKETNEPAVLQRLKIQNVNPSELAVLRQEFNAISGKGYGNVIRYCGMIEQKDAVALIMEDFPGEPVSGRVSNAPLSVDVFLDMAIQLADVVGELHQDDMIHGAITPFHILVDMKTGDVRLTGFGFISSFTHENDALYDGNVIMDTLAYISPEQTGRMNRPVDYRTDLYSLGISFYHMLTGAVPFMDLHPMMMFHSHIARHPVSPSDIIPTIPRVLSDIVLRMIEKTPEDRYQNSYGLKVDLETCRSHLRNTGNIEPFTIGRHDISKRFNIPQKLYGREAEIEKLLASYEGICRGGKEVMLIAGPPGIGKTALVRELDKAIVEKNGYFISGKYEPLRKDVPISALIQAIMGLVREMLAESQKRISIWKDRILTAVGNNGRVITDVIPDVELILGPQPDVATLNAEETRNRFNFVIEGFIGAIATPEHPVVLFLDDLQWADTVSFELIGRLCGNPEIRHLFIIGSYRDSEVGSGHPLSGMITGIEHHGITVQSFALGPLREFDIRRLIVDFLKSSHEEGAILAALVYEKTGGNPFFINQFLKKLFEMKYISFEPGHGWRWDNDTLSGLQVTDNLVELLVDKIRGLSNETIEILKICSCVGNRFDLDMISRVTGKTLDRVLPGITEAIREGLVGKTPQTYIFLHDRIQEAANSMIPDPDKAAYHYRIGRVEFERNDSLNLKKKLFYIVDQLKFGKNCISSNGEKKEFIRLCLDAGRKAKTATAYIQGTGYLQAGISLLDSDSWSKDYLLTYDLHRELLECLYLTGYFEEGEKLFEYTLSKTESITDIANLSSLMIILHTRQGNFEKAMAIGYQATRSMGHPLPRKTSDIRVALSLLRLAFKFKKIEGIIELPEIKDPKIIAFGHLFINTATVVYYTNPNLFALTTIEGNRITFRHGNWEMSDFSLAGLACILGSGTGRHSLAYRFGRTALAMSDRKPGHTNRCKINFLFGMVILPWTRHASESIDYFRKAYKYGIECGDRLFASHSINLIGMYRTLLGHPIDDILEEYTGYQDFMHSGKDPFVKTSYTVNVHALLCLKGRLPRRHVLDDDEFSEREIREFYNSTGNDLGLFYLLCHLLRIRYLFGKFKDALLISDELKTFMQRKVGLGCLNYGDVLFYHSLTLTALYPDAGFVDKFRYRKSIRSNQKKMAFWAKNCPDNFRHKYLIVEAECLKIKGRHIRAVKAYRDAIKSATESGYTNDEALANELFANYWLSTGFPDIAGGCYTEACLSYQKFGAKAKVDQLVEEHPDLIRAVLLNSGETGRSRTDSLDLNTVISASQAISGEIQLGKLLMTMLKSTMENAGAERGFVILENNGALFVEAERDIRIGEIPELRSIPLEDHDGLSRSIVNYTARIRDILILDNAAASGDFTRDPYVLRHLPKSVLCLPVLNQGKLSAVIYFENNQTTKAFGPERIELVKILASQAAIAIDNSRLYEKMEENVRARTVQLDRTLKDVEDINKRTMDSIAYASLIQHSLLPDPAFVSQVLPESFVIWQPREVIGGDMYYIDRSGDTIVLALMDCTGHGIPGALMTMLAVSGLKQIVQGERECNPAMILTKLNRFIKASLRQDRPDCQSDAGLDAAVVSWNPDEGVLRFSGALIPLYHLTDKTLQKIKGNRQSIGYVKSDTDFEFTLHSLPLVDGLTLYLATDGFMDQLGDIHTHRMGSRALVDVLYAHHDKPFDVQKDALINALNRHRGQNPYTDDITVLGFRIGREPSVSRDA